MCNYILIDLIHFTNRLEDRVGLNIYCTDFPRAGVKRNSNPLFFLRKWNV